jgi:hypothetical protein
VRYDVLNNRIPEIEYPKYKNDILGLCVTDMYVEMIENNKSVEDLLKSYKNYIPKELYKYHKIFAKKEIEHSIKGIRNKGHDALSVFSRKSVIYLLIDLSVFQLCQGNLSPAN